MMARWQGARAPTNPETKALEDLVESEITDNSQWHAFLREIEAKFPDDWVADGRPPGVGIPSYQLVVAYELPNSSRIHHLVFRLSFLAPFYDFYESERDTKTRDVVRYLRPTSASRARARAIGALITRRFGLVELDPEIGKTPVLGIAMGNLFPGKVTLADALFESSRRW